MPFRFVKLRFGDSLVLLGTHRNLRIHASRNSVVDQDNLKIERFVGIASPAVGSSENSI